MNYANLFVTLAIGHKNAAGDWIVTDHVDVLAIPTSCPQIVITPPPDKTSGNYNLTHLQSGFFLLGGFPTIHAARDAATRLAQLFPILDWDQMGEISRSWARPRVRKLWKNLSPEDKLWMQQWGGPTE